MIEPENDLNSYLVYVEPMLSLEVELQIECKGVDINNTLQHLRWS
jgi:hypothetical protein